MAWPTCALALFCHCRYCPYRPSELHRTGPQNCTVQLRGSYRERVVSSWRCNASFFLPARLQYVVYLSSRLTHILKQLLCCTGQPKKLLCCKAQPSPFTLGLTLISPSFKILFMSPTESALRKRRSRASQARRDSKQKHIRSRKRAKLVMLESPHQDISATSHPRGSSSSTAPQPASNVFGSLPTEQSVQRPIYSAMEVTDEALRNVFLFRASPSDHSAFASAVATEMELVRQYVQLDLENNRRLLDPIFYFQCVYCGRQVSIDSQASTSSSSLQKYLRLLQNKIYPP